MIFSPNLSNSSSAIFWIKISPSHKFPDIYSDPIEAELPFQSRCLACFAILSFYHPYLPFNIAIEIAIQDFFYFLPFDIAILFCSSILPFSFAIQCCRSNISISF